MTASVLVVADDFTGANAAAAGFARAGMRAVTIGSHQHASTLHEFSARFDVLVATTDSRHARPEDAGRRIAEYIEAAWPVDLVCNRIDTTLRGNLAASTKSALETVGRLSGRRAVALCAPAHPAAGRHTVDGIQLLNGRRLELTELVRDPLNPIRTSDVAELLATPVGLRPGTVPLRTLTGDHDELVASIRKLIPRADVIIVDAISEEHLSLAANAAVEASDEVVWVAVDPGPGSLALATALGLRQAAGRHRPPVLAVSGSATELSRLQVQRLLAEHPTAPVRARVNPDTGTVDVEPLIAATRRAFDRSSGTGLVIVATAIDDADIAHADAQRLPADVATAMRQVIEVHAISALFCGGGDVAAALIAEMGATGLEVEREIVPLAVAGAVVGGRWDGLPIATKGGLIGAPDTLVACVRYLTHRAELTRHSVPVGTDPSMAPAEPNEQ